MNKPIVSIKNFSLKIGNKQIVKQLDFEVFPGEVFAFLGSNGSGKTSTIRSLLGIYQASSGELLINGEKLTPETAAIVGYLPEERGLYTRAKVLDAMIYFGELKGMDREEARKEAPPFSRVSTSPTKLTSKSKNSPADNSKKSSSAWRSWAIQSCSSSMSQPKDSTQSTANFCSISSIICSKKASQSSISPTSWRRSSA